MKTSIKLFLALFILSYSDTSFSSCIYDAATPNAPCNDTVTNSKIDKHQVYAVALVSVSAALWFLNEQRFDVSTFNNQNLQVQMVPLRIEDYSAVQLSLH